jgi:ATP-dependent Clp protease ATP-binding subunit ClpC
MFERFTDDAKQAIMLSEQETLDHGYDQIGPGHLLLGLIGVPAGIAGQVLLGHGVALPGARDETVRQLTAAGVVATGGRAPVEALASIGIDADEVRRRMDATFGPGKFRYPRPTYTPQARDALIKAVDEAGAADIGTGHMLLGLLSDSDSVAVGVLTRLGVDAATVRSETRRRLG